LDQHQSAFENPYIALLIGAAVSLDVIALTFSSPRVYSGDKSVWLRWAKYNAGWHAGLLLFYLLAIDVISVIAQYIGYFLSIPLPDWLGFIATFFEWLSERFRSHIVIYASIFAMAFVWRQYSYKIVDVPTKPLVENAPLILRWLFRKRRPQGANPDTQWFWHLSACLVAVDMIALAAVVKSGEKLIQFPQGFDKFEGSFEALNAKLAASFSINFLAGTFIVTAAVFTIVGALCFISCYVSKLFWSTAERKTSDDLTSTIVVFLLKILEPLIIFYFIIHSMAFLATGVPLHSPAFLLGSGFLVAALLQFVGLSEVVKAATAQASASKVGQS